jgi:hypothetical protein
VDVEIPVTLNPELEPVNETCEKVSVVLPLFFSVMGCELLFPTATFVNVALVGLAAGWAWSPVPLKAIPAGEPGTLLVRDTLPEALPPEVGAYVTVNVLFAPGAIIIGALRFVV